MQKLKGKSILVTGSSQGIGKAIILMAAESGAKVAINYHQEDDRENAKRVKNQALKKGAEAAIIIQGDVTNYQSCQNLVQKTKKEFGSLDLLVNNAGILSAKNLEDEEIGKLQAVVQVNLIGYINMIHAAIPALKKQEESVIVNIASMAGLQAFPGFATYCASKWGVVGLTKSLGKELAPHNIDIYAVAPGAVDTPMIKGLDFQGMPPEKVAKRVLNIATGTLKLKTGGISELPS